MYAQAFHQIKDKVLLYKEQHLYVQFTEYKRVTKKGDCIFMDE